MQLVLENGQVFIGDSFGFEAESDGEVVFNTGMTGYQEILSDPSYYKQIVTLTYPLIGNYGINRDDFESMRPFIAGLIVRQATKNPSNWRSTGSIGEFLRMSKLPGIEGIDTRKLTRVIRQHGTLRGKICDLDQDPAQIAEQLRQTPLPRDQVQHASISHPYKSPGRGQRIVVVDLGAKQGIIRDLISHTCDVVVVPYNMTAEDILAFSPDGIMLSNGPGNPVDVPETIATLRELLGKIPLFGICLGHQILALACGGRTRKMKFGHRGSNHPVKNLQTGSISITSQNHGYTIEENSLKETRLKITHLSVNDETIEGIEHLDYPAFGSQYHPEASPGPEDNKNLYNRFFEMIAAHTRNS